MHSGNLKTEQKYFIIIILTESDVLAVAETFVVNKFFWFDVCNDLDPT